MAKEYNKVKVQIAPNKFKWARICPICEGHEPVTKSPTAKECDGHIGLRDHLRPF